MAIFDVWSAYTGEPYRRQAISTIIAATLAFIGNRFWTWRHRERTGLGREYVLYFGFNPVGLLIGIALPVDQPRRARAIWPGVFDHPTGGCHRRQGGRRRAGLAVPVLGLPPVRVPATGCHGNR